MLFLFWLHYAATLYMTGVIWFVQVVHYPLFASVGAKHFTAYQKAHVFRTSLIVIPGMLTELGSAAVLLFSSSEMNTSTTYIFYAASLLIAVNWASTFLLQVPQHRRLEESFDAAAHRKLVGTNWIRTVAWSLRAVLLTYVLYRFSISQ